MKIAHRIRAFERLVAPDVAIDRGFRTPCWIEEESSKCHKGYVYFYAGGKSRRRHCVAWEIATGRPVRKGFTLDHLCRQKDCWRPSHCEEVTRSVNTARGNRANPRSTEKAREARRALRKLLLGEEVKPPMFGPIERAEAKCACGHPLAMHTRYVPGHNSSRDGCTGRIALPSGGFEKTRQCDCSTFVCAEVN